MPRPIVPGRTTAPMSGPTDATEQGGKESDRAVLARSFDATAAAYELGRPEYPDEALTFWDDHGAFERANVVLDLAAGTGKLTRLLPIICELHAVEPLEQMRAEFGRAVADVDVVDGTAEHIPYPDDHFDAVLVAQAFHWFDHRRALDEIARVLKPSGGLGLIWNEDDVGAAAWLADVVQQKRATAASTMGDVSATEVIDAHSAFGAVESFECSWERVTSTEGVLADVLSRSYVSALAPQEQLGVLTRSREAIERHLGSGVEEIVYPYRTTALWAPLLTATDPA
jgi:ubiquinone/menaquinone biosynthesis C-methylase UbiE